MKLEFSPQIFEKYSNMKLYKNRVGAGLFHTDGRTNGERDRHDEANSCSSHFGESRLKMNHSLFYMEVIAVSSEIRTLPNINNILTCREVWCKSNFSPIGILYTQGHQYISPCYTMGTGSFAGVNRPGRDVNHPLF